MDFDVVDWDDESFARGNTQHILAAGITQEEFEEALDSFPLHELGRSRRPDRYTAIGTTRNGREIRLIFEYENARGYVTIRPITAFDVD